jgi:hypothetical protein
MELLSPNRNKFFILAVLFLCASSCFSQSFKKLSAPEKRWVLFHPIKAKKAAAITRQVQKDIDSIKQSGIIGNDNNGGALDAFKHAYWMALLSKNIGIKNALKIGKVHEKGNYLQFKKQKNEDAVLPDSVSCEMDLFNNNVGAHIYGNCKTIDNITVQKKLLEALKEGKLKMIKKDASGTFLTCSNTPIQASEWKGKWGIPKCLINSY